MSFGDTCWSPILLRRISVSLMLVTSLRPSDENLIPDATGHQQTSFLREYCQQQQFAAGCPEPNGVIVMDVARYGRMREGKCITGHYGKLNCSTDALWYFDRRCSGRSKCRVVVGDPNLVKLNPCHAKDLVSYLEAKFHCVTASGSTQLCRSNRPILLTSAVGYIASETAASAGIGSTDCPFRIQAGAGQRIQLTMLIFTGKELPSASSASSSDDPDDSSNSVYPPPTSETCYDIGSVYGHGQKKTLTACSGGGGGADRGAGRVLYRSDGNNVTLELHSKYNLKELAPFVIKYESFGCQSPPPAPTGGWVRANPDSALVGCNGSDQESWTLTCTGSRWIGHVGNCTAAPSSPLGASAATQSDDNFPYGILVVVAIGVALGVFIGGTLLTIVAFCMKRTRPDSSLATDCLSAADTIDDPYGRSSDLRCSIHDDHHHRRYRLNPVPLLAGPCYPPLSDHAAETLVGTVYDDQDVILCRTTTAGGKPTVCPGTAGTFAAAAAEGLVHQPVMVTAAGPGTKAPCGGQQQQQHRSLHLYETPQFG